VVRQRKESASPVEQGEVHAPRVHTGAVDALDFSDDGKLLAMAKNLPNVTIDMSWTYVISPSFASRFLNEAIETVPADKILAFGGDYQVPEGAYAHAMLCREVVARVLADKVTAGYWTEEEALRFARAALRENSIRVFRLAPPGPRP